ncbi:uncharacterized protein L199_005325 [Kwoniella botswanensis]|uniref:uncharacterized protein n=1 Tax=Kwoniella botswanensis TaxID=1268659 RepID=UPI00315DDFE2
MSLSLKDYPCTTSALVSLTVSDVKYDNTQDSWYLTISCATPSFPRQLGSDVTNQFGGSGQYKMSKVNDEESQIGEYYSIASVDPGSMREWNRSKYLGVFADRSLGDDIKSCLGRPGELKAYGSLIGCHDDLYNDHFNERLFSQGNSTVTMGSDVFTPTGTMTPSTGHFGMPLFESQASLSPTPERGEANVTLRFAATEGFAGGMTYEVQAVEVGKSGASFWHDQVSFDVIQRNLTNEAFAMDLEYPDGDKTDRWALKLRSVENSRYRSGTSFMEGTEIHQEPLNFSVPKKMRNLIVNESTGRNKKVTGNVTYIKRIQGKANYE